MAVDGEEGEKPPAGSGAQNDDLAEYHLDDYDDDVDEEGACRRSFERVSSCSILLDCLRDRSVYGYQRIDVLPR